MLFRIGLRSVADSARTAGSGKVHVANAKRVGSGNAWHNRAMCLVALVGWFVPRIALIGCWLLGWTRAVEPWWLLILGWLTLPYTTLAYVCIDHYAGNVDGLGHLIVLIVALSMDLGTYGGSRRRKRESG
jgi:hypothetical protein